MRLLRRRRQPTKKDRPPPYEVPGTGVKDLAQMIFAVYYAVPPPLRRDALWVMDPFWLNHCRAYSGTTGQAPPLPAETPLLLDKPVLVIENGGWPHLEPAVRSHPHPTPR